MISSELNEICCFSRHQRNYSEKVCENAINKPKERIWRFPKKMCVLCLERRCGMKIQVNRFEFLCSREEDPSLKRMFHIVSAAILTRQLKVKSCLELNENKKISIWLGEPLSSLKSRKGKPVVIPHLKEYQAPPLQCIGCFQSFSSTISCTSESFCNLKLFSPSSDNFQVIYRSNDKKMIFFCIYWSIFFLFELSSIAAIKSLFRTYK